MKSYEDFFKTPSAREFINELKYEVLKAQRPPDQVILDETGFCKYLNISKRHAADLRSEGKIIFSKAGGKLYYLLSNVLKYVERYQVKSVDSNNRLLKK